MTYEYLFIKYIILLLRCNAEQVLLTSSTLFPDQPYGKSKQLCCMHLRTYEWINMDTYMYVCMCDISDFVVLEYHMHDRQPAFVKLEKIIRLLYVTSTVGEPGEKE